MTILIGCGYFAAGFALCFILVFLPGIVRYLRRNVRWDYPVGYYSARRWYRLNRLSLWHRAFLLLFFLVFWAGSWLLSFAIRP